MLRFFCLLTTLLSGFELLAQKAGFEYRVQHDLNSVKISSVRFLDLPNDSAGFIPLPEMAPEPASLDSRAKSLVDSQRHRRFHTQSLDKYRQNPIDIKPQVETDYNGLPIGGAGIPNDNNLAVSNDGFVVSVVNSIVTMFDREGNHIGFKSLSAFVEGALPNLDRTYDPKVIYDPEQDRFILVFLQGSLSADTRIVVGFSHSSDPREDWNFYAINGNPFGGAYWSDYPIIGINGSDLFITVNILRDNGSWQDDFIQSLIWQVDKQSGFSGADTLYQTLYSDITFESKPVWSICAVQEVPLRGVQEMYFLSVRPGDLSNDTVFLNKVSGSQRSGNGFLSMEMLKAPLAYGVPPTAYQPAAGFRLQTNDARVLSAIKVGSTIQYVQTSSVPGSDPSGLYHGTIDLDRKLIEAQYIFSDTVDFAYPSIAFAGDATNPQSAYTSVITFSHVSELDFPGTSAVFHNRLPGMPAIYSPVIRIREGEGIINTFVADSAERWGDYTGIQPQYNEPGVVWMAGSYGMARERNGVWIGKIRVNGVLEPEWVEESVIVYPNPVAGRSYVRMSIPESGELKVMLSDVSGKELRTLYSGEVRAGLVEFYFDKGGLRPGVYMVSLFGSDGQKPINTYKIAIVE